jgi:hypothetical protein
MKAPFKTKIEGFEGEFEFCPIPLSKALKLNRKIEKMTLNALKSLEALKAPLVDLILSEGSEEGVTDQELSNMVMSTDIEKLMEVGEKIFSTLSDDEFEQFVKDLLSSSKYIVVGLGAVDITDDKHFSQIFSGNVAGIYPVIFQSMKYNNFTPFALAGIGNVMKKIGFSPLVAKDQ